MPGESQAPYRVPCFLSNWPTTRNLTLCGGQHIVDAERRVPTYCNTATVGVTPSYVDEGACGDGSTWNNGNCYAPCPIGNAAGMLTDGSISAGNTVIIIQAGWTGTLYQGDLIQIDTDPNVYVVSDVSTMVAGNFFSIDAPGIAFRPDSTPLHNAIPIPSGSAVNVVTLTYGGVAVRDYSSCNKTRWKAVRAQYFWQGKNGFGTGGCNGCPPCEGRTTRYLRADVTVIEAGTTGSTVEYPLGGAYTLTMHRAVEVDKVTGLLSEPSGGCSDELTGTGDLSGHDTPYWLGQAFLQGTWDCGPQIPETGWPGSLDGTAEALNAMLREACAGDGTANQTIGDAIYSVAITGTSDTLASFVLTMTEAGLGGTYSVTWSLSGPNTLEDVVNGAYGLANTWDLSDDIQYPWRQGPYIQYRDEADRDIHNPIPLVRLRALEPQGLRCPLTCGSLVTCEVAIHDPCPYDGATIGAPLGHGYGPHYGFWKKDCTSYDIGWNPGFGLPSTATWWTHSAATDSNASTFPAGGWVHVNSAAGIVTVQKWAEVQEVNTSYNFFRPCGADRICQNNHVLIASAVYEGTYHTVNVALADPFYGLATGDKVDFAKYDSSFVETLDTGASKATPDTAGYTVTVVDETHFWLGAGGEEMAGVPAGFTHIKRHGEAPCAWSSYSDYRAICGRSKIASIGLDTGTNVLSMTLAAAEDYLSTGDKVDFVKYDGSFAETVDNGASKVSPDSAGYSVSRTDSTHFTISSMGAIPSGYDYIKSHSAPHFKWYDDGRKGDFVWCYNLTHCDDTPVYECSAGCLPFSPCFPAVAAVLCGTESYPYPETFGNAQIKELEYGISARVLWKPRMSEHDPAFGGENYVESMCPDALPYGSPDLPSGFSFIGCGSLPAARPAMAMRGLGDAVAVVAQPIAIAIDMATSILPKRFRTDLKNCQGCHGKGGRQERLNKAVPFQT